MSDELEIDHIDEVENEVEEPTHQPTDRDRKVGDTDSIEDKVVQLYLRTGSPTYIIKTLGIPKWKIYDILKKRGIKPFRSRSRDGGEGYPTTPPTGASPAEFVVESVGPSEVQAEPPIAHRAPHSVAPAAPRMGIRPVNVATDLGPMTEREIVAFATPVLRKVVLNPKILLYYDYFRSKGYKGDLGDFICECIELLFKKMGYQIVIEKRSEVE